jgi:hypothetical protein
LLCPQDVRKMPKAKAGAYFSATSSRSARTATASSTAAAATQAVVGRVRNPLPAEHPAYALIGRVAAEWAQLEHALDIILWGDGRYSLLCRLMHHRANGRSLATL